MGAKTRSQVSSEREKWERVFNSLVKLLKDQKEQLQTLLTERKVLEARIKMQHGRWVSDVRFLQDHIFQLKENVKGKEMECLLEAVKSDLITGLNQREASFVKMKLEQTEDELADFRDWYDYLSRNLEGNTRETENGKRGHRTSDLKSKTLEAEVKRLKRELEKLESQKNFEIANVLQEKGFVWNQYKLLENDLESKLKSKQHEIDEANQKIARVLGTTEHLQHSNQEKDEIIARLKTKVAEMEAEASKCKEDTSKLSQELDLLRKSHTTQVTPSLIPCNKVARTSSNRSKTNSRNLSLKTESTPVQDPGPSRVAEKGNRGSKRKEIHAGTTSETPKLFSSSFKIPKLKASSTPLRCLA